MASNPPATDDSFADPKLGLLTDNGGPTLTMALLPGSPAIDAGNTALAPTTDQRGFPRPAGLAADIGAFEYAADILPRIASLPGSGVTGTSATLNATVNPKGFPAAAWFEWGTTTSYGDHTPVTDIGSGTNDLPFSVPLAGLTPGVTYHYCIAATNSNGAVYGSDQAFGTGGPPQVSTLSATAVTTNGALLNGTVNPDGYSTTAWFEWGTTASYGNLTTATEMGSGTDALPLLVPLAGLTPGVTYHYRIAATNSNGAVYGSDQAFGTGGPPQVSTLSATAVTTSGAVLNGTVNPHGLPTAAWFEWGITSSYGNLTPVTDMGGGTNALPLSVPVGGLTSGRTYHFRVVATNSTGAVYGSDQTFLTLALPQVSTSSAIAVTNDAATLKGTVNPKGFPTAARFQWGTTTNYGNLTPVSDMGSGTTALTLSALLAGLTPGATYHFRVAATNSAGAVYGADQPFVTPGPPRVWTLSALAVAIERATLDGAVNPDGHPTAGWFQWGTTSSYGNLTPVTNMGSGTNELPLSIRLAGLTPGATYHYCIVATNSAGAVYGTDQAFTTRDHGDTNTVTSLADSGAGSLRQVMADSLPGDSIVFRVTGRITLAGSELVVDKDLSIIGPGASALDINAASLSRVFNIRSNVIALIVGLTVSSGKTPLPTGSLFAEPGGGICNSGSLWVSNCVISFNVTGSGGDYGGGGSGAGICNFGTLRLDDSTVTHNEAGAGAGGGPGGSGGGIWNGGTCFVNNSSFVDNRAGFGGWGFYDQGSGVPGGRGGDGGGIFNSGTMALTNCTIDSNLAGDGGEGPYGLSAGWGGAGGHGGGICNDNDFSPVGNLSLVCCTVVSNRSGMGGPGRVNEYLGAGGSGGYGGGISGVAALTNCTVVGNYCGPGGDGSPRGGGGRGGGFCGGGTLVNDIVALNSVPDDGFGPDVYGYGEVQSVGNNLIGVTNGSGGFTAPGDLVGSSSSPLDPEVAPLAENGGPTLTVALLPGSPAIDAGNTLLAPATDQRGFPRTAGAAADIGAFEYGSVMPTLAITGSGATGLNILGRGNANQSCRLLSSPDMSSWIPIATNQIGNDGAVLFDDTCAPGSLCRFYRLVMP